MAHVLVIDDDQMVATLLKEHLSEEGYQVTCVTQAEQGFESATQSPPDLIMLDVNLPDATGFQMCWRFRQNPTTQGIPIIMMTGAARWPNQQQIGRDMGANDYILKPFDVLKVGEQVHKLMGDKRPKRPSDTPSPEPAEPTTPIELKKAMPPADVVAMNGHSGDAKMQVVPADSAPAAEDAGPPITLLPDSPLEPIPASNAAEAPSIPEPATPLPALEQAPEPAVAAPVAEEPEPAPDMLPDSPQTSPEPVAPVAAEPNVSLLHQDLVAAAPSPAPAPAPATEAASAAPATWRWPLAWSLLVFHMSLTGTVVTVFDHGTLSTMQGVSYVLGGWALLLGLLSASAAVLNIQLRAREAFEILGLAAIPIVLRGVAQAAAEAFSIEGLRSALDAGSVPAATAWMRPLDVFEMVALLVIGLSLRRQPGGSLKKALVAVVLIAAAWTFSAHGYFRP